jgi:hypothetical protein
MTIAGATILEFRFWIVPLLGGARGGSGFWILLTLDFGISLG